LGQPLVQPHQQLHQQAPLLLAQHCWQPPNQEQQQQQKGMSR
jgi:hypothetical protein